MTFRIASAALTLFFGALLAGGCGDERGTGFSPGSPASIELSFSTLETREAAHHRAAISAADGLVLRSETRRYATDMDSLMDAMMDSCRAMGSGGMMRDHDMRRMRDLAVWMDDAVGGHRARMDSLLTLGEMRAECAEHHDEMLGLLGEIHDALPGRGMMGGGKMGGDMM